MSFPDVAVLAAPLYVLVIAGEVAFLASRGRRAEATVDLPTNIVMGLGNALSSLLYAGIVGGALLAIWQLRVFEMPLTWWSFLISMVGADFAYYWSHRVQHRMRWGWASHVIHHSSQGYNFSTAVRQPWFGVTTGTWIFAAPLILLGVHPALHAFSISLNLFYQFFVHTQAVGRLHPWVEAVFNTPSHHRVHHAVNPRYLDRNYAGILIVWDRLFGTFEAEDKAEPCRFGLVSNIATRNPLRVATHEYAAIFRDALRPGLKLRQRLAYVFAEPGYSHDGSRLTTREIKRRAALRLSGGEGAAMGAVSDATPTGASAR